MEQDASGDGPQANGKKKLLWWCIFVSITALVTAAGIAIVSKRQASSLLPTSIVQKASTFTPYFYDGHIPAGYSLDDAHISFDQDILIMPLTKPGKPGVVLTEQPLPRDVSPQEIQQNGDKVNGTPAPATINSIEGRLLGTMIVSDAKGRTLLLLNTSGNTDKADLTALLQGLKPAP